MHIFYLSEYNLIFVFFLFLFLLLCLCLVLIGIYYLFIYYLTQQPVLFYISIRIAEVAASRTVFEVLGLESQVLGLDLEPFRSSKIGLSSVEDSSFLLP